MQRHHRAIWWIKRDLRLHDNTALHTAVLQSKYVLPVYVFEPSLLSSPETSSLHITAQQTALNSLKKSLQNIGANVCILTGEIPNVFSQLQKDYAFTAIYSHQETGSNITYERDKRVLLWCHAHGIVWSEFLQNAVIRGKRIEKLDRHMWDTFMHTEQAPKVTTMVWDGSLEKLCFKQMLPAISQQNNHTLVQPVTESAAHRVLTSFLTKRGETYWGSISSPNTAWFHGSRLSPHLAWGTLSLRHVFQETQQRIETATTQKTKQWNHSLEAFSSRLYWHDHFMQKLESFPELEFHSSDARYTNIKYKDNEQDLQRWLHGMTGFPLLDATMRCLRQTGFVNFRMRAMAISFAAFGLHLSWRTIMYPFARLMADYEPGIHIYQVQMQSGVTKGKALRVYTPEKQQLEKDSECTFIKKWIPELQLFSPIQIYTASYHSEKFGTTKKEKLGTYPLPMIHFGRQSLAMKKQIIACRKTHVQRKNAQLSFV